MRVIFTIILLSTALGALGQGKPLIKAEALLEKMKAYDVFTVMYSDSIRKDTIDFIGCHYSDSLKTKLLNLLYPEAYQNLHLLPGLMNHYFGDSARAIERIHDWLRDRSWETHSQLYRHLWDSMSVSKALYNELADSVKNEIIDGVRSSKYSIFNNPEWCEILARMHWPEVYNYVHEEWEKEGHPFNSLSMWMLTIMRCPDAYRTLSDSIDSFSKIDNKIRESKMFEYLNEYDAPYLFGLEEKLLKVQSNTLSGACELSSFEGDSIYVPYNVNMLSELSIWETRIFYNSGDYLLKDLIHKSWGAPSMSEQDVKKLSDEIANNADRFSKALEPVIRKSFENDLYWIKDMPYYRKEEEEK